MKTTFRHIELGECFSTADGKTFVKLNLQRGQEVVNSSNKRKFKKKTVVFNKEEVTPLNRFMEVG